MACWISAYWIDPKWISTCLPDDGSIAELAQPLADTADLHQPLADTADLEQPLSSGEVA